MFIDSFLIAKQTVCEIVEHVFGNIFVCKVATDKPGGTVLLWLYGYENNEWIVRFADPIRKALLSRLPLRLVHAMSLPVAATLWILLKLGVAPIEFFRMARNFSFDHLRAIVFDHMIPVIARYYRRAEAAELLRRAGLENIQVVWVNEMSRAVSGIKPATR